MKLNALAYIYWSLFLTFLILQLCHVISWSWWWITAPLWIPVAASLLIKGAVWIALKLESPEDRRARRIQELIDQCKR